MHQRDTGGAVLGLIAVVVIMSMFSMLGCAGSGDTGLPPIQQDFRDATAADLQNIAFTFADGVVFNGALANQEVILDFGQFDATNTAPFRLQSGGLFASGTATLQSPLTLTLRIIEPGLPWIVRQEMRFNAEIDDSTGSLALDDTPASTMSTSTPGIASPHPPVLLEVALSGVQEVPPVTTTASGSAALSLNADQTRLAFTLEYTNLPAVQEAHIHVGAIGDTGDILLFLCTNLANPATEPPPTCPTPAGMITGTLTAAELLGPAEGSGLTVRTFAEAITALLDGDTYVDVHTAAFPEGEIRGQIAQEFVPPPPPPPPPPPTVSFAADILPIFTSIDLGFGFRGCGNGDCHAGGSPAGGLNLTAGQAYINLVGVPSTQNPALKRVEPGDPDNSYLFRKHTGEGISGARMPLINPTFFDDGQRPDLLELERQWIEQGALNN